MNRALDTAQRFDRISEVYDETREPLTEDAFDKAASILTKDGCKRILEVGIGTGRIAKPLQDREFEIVGVDLSRGMLAIARRKGIVNIVIGDANQMPFEDKIFDAAVLAHVIHLLENPAETFERVAQVARTEVIAFVRKRDGTSYPIGDERSVLRQTFRKVAEEMGITIPSGPGDWRQRFRNETEFLSSYPPSELVTIQDVPVVTTLGERLSFFEKRAYGYPSDIPDDVFRKLIEGVRSSIDTGKEIRYRREEQMAIWRLPH